MLIKKLCILNLVSVLMITHNCFGMRRVKRLGQEFAKHHKNKFFSPIFSHLKNQKMPMKSMILIGTIVAASSCGKTPESLWDKFKNLIINGKALEKALMEAIKNNEPEKVFSILEKGLNPNFKDESGSTPLHHAALSRQDNACSIVMALLQKKADPNVKDNAENTPLYYATGKLHLSPSDKQIIALLLQYGADKKEAVHWTLPCMVDPECAGDRW